MHSLYKARYRFDICMATADHFLWSDEPSHNTDLYHPHEKAPHCLPCHWTQADEQQSLRAVDSYLPFAPYTGCPCTAEQVCRHDSRQLYQASCDTQLHPLPVRWDLAHEPSPWAFFHHAKKAKPCSNHFLDVAVMYHHMQYCIKKCSLSCIQNSQDATFVCAYTPGSMLRMDCKVLLCTFACNFGMYVVTTRHVLLRGHGNCSCRHAATASPNNIPPSADLACHPPKGQVST